MMDKALETSMVKSIHSPMEWINSSGFYAKLEELGVFKSKHELTSFIGNLRLLLKSNPKLNECSLNSFVDVILKVAHFRLPLGLDYVHLIPYRTRNEPQPRCTMQLSYKGIIKLLARSGIYFSASCVYSQDEFGYEEGTSPFVKHKRSLNARRQNGDNNFICVYAIARYKDMNFIEIMTKDEIEFIKNESQKYKVSDCWKNYPDEMAKKTVIKRLAKNLPIELEDIKEEWEYELKDSHSCDVEVSTSQDGLDQPRSHSPELQS